jgi:hypothetical protein
MAVLQQVAKLGLPDCFVAAGFVRNKVWDTLYGTTTRLNDIDVVFFDSDDEQNKKESLAQNTLDRLDPEIKWQVKNQAFMHSRNHDPEYSNTADAMCYWPEKETAIGVRLAKNGQIEICPPFGVQSLLEGQLSHNPKRSIEVFKQRLEEKQWLLIWPKLQVVV